MLVTPGSERVKVGHIFVKKKNQVSIKTIKKLIFSSFSKLKSVKQKL